MGDPIMSATEIARVRHPIERACGLPNRAYTDDAWYQIEQERIFATRWVAATFVHRVSTPGDAVPVVVAGRPIVVVRGADGALRAFHNVCAYDSCEVVTASKSGLEHLVGAYHGWVWDLAGRLQSIPYWDGTPNPPLSLLPKPGDLLEIGCATWLDLVFVCLDPNPADFAATIAPIQERLSGVDLTEFEVAKGPDGTPWVSRGVVPANWKIAFENDVELLHESFVHEEYANSPFSPKVDAEGLMTCLDVADRGLFGLAAPIHEYFDEAESELLPLIPVAGRTYIERFHIYDLYPNVQMGFGANHFTLGIFSHESSVQTENEVTFYVHRSVAREPEVAAAVAAPWDATRVEDNVVCAATQRGRQTTAHEATYYAPFWDRLVHAFHQLVLDDLVGP